MTAEERIALKIARDTLRMPTPMLMVMGGPAHSGRSADEIREEARRTIRELTGKEHGSPRARISHRAPRSAPGGNALGSLTYKAASKVAKLFTSKKH